MFVVAPIISLRRLTLCLAVLGLTACGTEGGDPSPPTADAAADAAADASTDSTADTDVAVHDVPNSEVSVDVQPEVDTIDVLPSDLASSDITEDGAGPDQFHDMDTGEDVVTEDSGPPIKPCDPGCLEGEICADGRCFADCGPSFDPLGLAASLTEGVEVVGSVCAPEGLAFFALSPSKLLRLDLEDGAPTSQMLLSATDWATESTELITVADVTGSFSAQEVFANDYLSVDESETRALFGFVGSFSQGMSGTIFLADLEQPLVSPLAIEAPGHFQATLVDASTILVNGQGAGGLMEGAGVYKITLAEGLVTVAKVVTNLGIGGGVVAVHGSTVLLTGHADPWPSECQGVPGNNLLSGTRVFVADLNAIDEAAEKGEPLDAFCDLQPLDLPPQLRFHPSGDILGRDTEQANYLTRYHWTKLANGVVFITGSEQLADGPAISDGRGVKGTNLVILSHSHGHLLVQ